MSNDGPLWSGSSPISGRIQIRISCLIYRRITIRRRRNDRLHYGRIRDQKGKKRVEVACLYSEMKQMAELCSIE